MPTSNDVTAGTNATAAHYNNLRVDARTRYVRYPFYAKGGAAVENNTANEYIVPATMTVTKIKTRISSGTSATIRIARIRAGVTAYIKSSMSVTTTLTDFTTSFTNTDLVEDDILQLDVTAVSGSPLDLNVEVVATELI
jgi:hypothetical protein